MLTFRRNKNLKELIGQHHISDNKKESNHTRKAGGSRPCLSQIGNVCCKHIISTKTFQSDNTGKTYQIRHNLNCHSRNITYLGHCILCPKKQYVGKSEPPVNKRIYNHRKDSKKTGSIAFDQHFQLPIEQVNPSSLKGKTLSKFLRVRRILDARTSNVTAKRP